MSEFRFDPKTLGWSSEEIPDMSCPEPAGALEAFVVLSPGIEAIKQIAGLANIEWSEAFGNRSADDIDTTRFRQDHRDLP